MIEKFHDKRGTTNRRHLFLTSWDDVVVLTDHNLNHVNYLSCHMLLWRPIDHLIDCLVLSEHLFRCFNSNDSHSLVLLLPVPFLSWQLWIADICSKFQKNYCLTGHFLKSMWCMKDEVDRYMITCLSHITSVTLILDCVSVRQTFVCCHLPDRRKFFHSIFLKLVLIRTFWLVIDSSFFLLILILIYHFTWFLLTNLIMFSCFSSYFYSDFN